MIDTRRTAGVYHSAQFTREKVVTK